MRCQLALGNGSQLSVANQVAPNINLAANLFQSMELQINGKTISKCSDHVGEVDTLEQRLHKSKSWTDSVGASINWLQESIEDRISAVSVDGVKEGTDFVIQSNHPSLNIQANTDCLLIINPATPTIMMLSKPSGVFVQADADAWNAKIRVGDIIITADKRSYRVESVAGITTGYLTLTISTSTLYPIGGISTFPGFAIGLFQVHRPKPARRVKQFEIIWRPMCLSIFKYGGALPTGKYSLILTPYNASGNNYQIRAVEIPKSVSVGSIPVFGSLASNISFNVLDTRFYRATIEGERVEDLTYYLDLENTSYQAQNLQITTSLTKQYFDVPPLTHALSICYQNRNAGIDLRQSASRFVCNGYDSKTNEFTGVVNNELTLQRIFVTYGGRSYPQPDGDPSYIVGSAADYTTQRYIETITNSGGLFSEGGTESIQEWQARGAYHHISTPKDGSDRSTRVVVNSQFSSQFANEANIVLFAHSKSTAMVSIVRGLVCDVQVLDS
jgi:hypothetical protein